MDRTTHIIDADKKVAGRLASEVAFLLQGKNKVSYQPHTDCGDNVQVRNVAGIVFTGRKIEDKIYQHATGYPGGLRETKLSDLHKNNPELLFQKMVYRMLPKNKLRERMIKRLQFISSKESK